MAKGHIAPQWWNKIQTLAESSPLVVFTKRNSLKFRYFPGASVLWGRLSLQPSATGLSINISCHIIFGSFAKAVCLFIQSHTICPILKRLIIFIKNMSFLTLQLLYLLPMLSTNIIISYQPHQQVFSILQNSELQRNGHHDRVLFLLHYDEWLQLSRSGRWAEQRSPCLERPHLNGNLILNLCGCFFCGSFLDLHLCDFFEKNMCVPVCFLLLW